MHTVGPILHVLAEKIMIVMCVNSMYSFFSSQFFQAQFSIVRSVGRVQKISEHFLITDPRDQDMQYVFFRLEKIQLYGNFNFSLIYRWLSAAFIFNITSIRYWKCKIEFIVQHHVYPLALVYKPYSDMVVILNTFKSSALLVPFTVYAGQSSIWHHLCKILRYRSICLKNQW